MSRLEFWYEFASTYSYPAVMRVERIAAGAGVTVVWRPFLLGVIFKQRGFEDSPFNANPVKGRYMWRDLARLCADLDVPFRRPDPFPQNSLLAARVALVALDQDWGEAFCVALFRAQFGDGRRIDDDGVLGDVLATLQVDPSPVLAAARSDAIKTRLRAQTEEAQRLGLFGSPSFTTEDGELFWGNDRLEAALRWAAAENRE